MPFEVSRAARLIGQHGFRHWKEVTIRDGDFTNGNQHDQTIQSGQRGVIGELQVGFDSPVENALALVLGDLFERTSTGQGQTQAGSIDVDLETAADGEATAGAKAGFGIVREPDKPADNGIPLRDEAVIDAAVTNRELQKKVWANKSPLVIGTEGEFVTFVAEAPPSTNESYGMDHAGIELTAQILTSEGLNRARQASGGRGRV